MIPRHNYMCRSINLLEIKSDYKLKKLSHYIKKIVTLNFDEFFFPIEKLDC